MFHWLILQSLSFNNGRRNIRPEGGCTRSAINSQDIYRVRTLCGVQQGPAACSLFIVPCSLLLTHYHLILAYSNIPLFQDPAATVVGFTFSNVVGNIEDIKVMSSSWIILLGSVPPPITSCLPPPAPSLANYLLSPAIYLSPPFLFTANYLVLPAPYPFPCQLLSVSRLLPPASSPDSHLLLPAPAPHKGFDSGFVQRLFNF